MLYILICIGISCCQENSLFDFENDKYPGVDESLWPFFENFELEGAKRGLSIDLVSSQSMAKIHEIHEGNVAGVCSYGISDPGEVTIDRSFWNRSTWLSREMIVFHELGHCYLERDHNEETFTSGYCVSIMRSGTCCCRDAYNIANRAYYLDELFGILKPQ